jgi:hypothetical protein
MTECKADLVAIFEGEGSFEQRVARILAYIYAEDVHDE